MRGHEPILALRRRGRCPSIVFLDDMPDESKLPDWRLWPSVSPGRATVLLSPTDQPHRLDLRFAVGLFVVLTGYAAQRLQAIEAALIAFGAARVVSAVINAPGDELSTDVTVFDTAGIAAMPRDLEGASHG